MAMITRKLPWLLWKAAKMWWVMCKLVLDDISEQNLAPLVADLLRQSWWRYISQICLKDSQKNRLLYSGPLSCLLAVFTWSWQNEMLVSDVIPPLLLSHKMTICHLTLKGHFFTFFQASVSIKLLCGLMIYPFESNFIYHCIWSLAAKI